MKNHSYCYPEKKRAEEEKGKSTTRGADVGGKLIPEFSSKEIPIQNNVQLRNFGGKRGGAKTRKGCNQRLIKDNA